MQNESYCAQKSRAKRELLVPVQCGVLMLVVGVLNLVGFTSAYAEAFLPQDDNQILERVSTAGNVIGSDLRRMREALSQNPYDLPLAIDLAQRYLEIGRTEADPRFAGYAQAVLGPWWNQSPPPAEVQLLRAILRQRRHDFTGALDDLSRVLEAQPYSAQAWLTRAVILEVRGDYSEAMRSCLQLFRLTSTLAGTTCTTSVASLSGQAKKSYRLLRQTLQESPDADLPLRLWATTVLAEVADRLGYEERAEAYFRQALSLDRRDNSVLTAYADFLLERNRPEEVLSLLKQPPLSDAQLLRLVMAEKQLDSPRLHAHVESLRARFAAVRLRDPNAHLSSEARFNLHVLYKPAEALRLAQQNWSVQRTPADARLFLEAAITQGNTEAAKPVVEWLKHTGLEDSAITKLVQRLEEMRS